MDQNYNTDFGRYTQPTFREKNAAYYRQRGREALKGKWGYAILAALLFGLLAGSSSGLSLPSFDFELSGEDWQTLSDASTVWSWDSLLGLLLIGIAAAGVTYLLLTLLVGSPVRLGYQKFNLDLIDGKEAKIGTLFGYFGICYGKSVWLSVLHGVVQFVISLPLLIGTVLFVGTVGIGFIAQFMTVGEDVGAIGSLIDAVDIFAILFGFLILSVAAVVTMVLQVLVGYRLAYAFTILAEYPEISAADALRNSWNLMRGKIWRLFCLQFSFIGWHLLIALAAVCTCGIGSIGYLVLTPYVNASTTAFYDDIANRSAAKEAEFPSIDPNDYMFTDGENGNPTV